MKPWKQIQWGIPPTQNSDFVAQMEQVLDGYKRPYDARYPGVCMDESPRQLIRATRPALPSKPGAPARHDDEYERCGVCNVFMAVTPLASTRLIQLTEMKNENAVGVLSGGNCEAIDRRAPEITLVLDHLNTHGPVARYETFAPPVAKALWDRFGFVYTPKHGSWLNRAEIELNVLIKQCRDRRIDTIAERQVEVAAWQNRRNNRHATINWQFTNEDARMKLKRLYPTLDD